MDKHQYPSVHRGIVRAAVQVLELEQHPAAAFFTQSALEILVAYADRPDKVGDWQQGRGMHYYCALTPKGEPCQPDSFQMYANGRKEFAPSPHTMLTAAYRHGLSLQFSGRYALAMQSLSRAAHMLADLCCPPHCSGMTYFSPYAFYHKRYEATAAELFWSSEENVDEAVAARQWAEKVANHVPYARIEAAFGANHPDRHSAWTVICNGLAESSERELHAVIGNDSEQMAASIERRIRLAIGYVAVLFAQFVRQSEQMQQWYYENGTAALPTDIELQNCWTEQTPYWIGRLTTVVSKEPFYIEPDEDGLLRLVTQERQYLTVSRWGSVTLGEDGTNGIIRFRFGYEPGLVLYPDGDQGRLLMLSNHHLRCVRRMGHWSNAMFRAHTQFYLTTTEPTAATYLL